MSSTIVAVLPASRRERVHSARILADVLPGGILRDVALVLGGLGFMIVSSWIVIPLPYTPVPITLQTLAVLLNGVVLGARRGLIANASFLVIGAAGVPIFAQGASGWTIPTFGYIIAFALAPLLTGCLAQRGWSRSALRMAMLGVFSGVFIYALGVAWLVAITGMTLAQGFSGGVLPFLIGDTLKIALAAGMVPTAWKLLEHD